MFQTVESTSQRSPASALELRCNRWQGKMQGGMTSGCGCADGSDEPWDVWALDLEETTERMRDPLQPSDVSGRCHGGLVEFQRCELTEPDAEMMESVLGCATRAL